MPDTSVDGFCFDLTHYRKTCPGCGSDVGWESCHFTYTTWKCLGCGANLDSRVVSPKSVHRDDVKCAQTAVSNA